MTDILPTIEVLPLEMPDLDVAPVLEITPALEYEGSLEWSVSDQAAFEGAVVEHNLQSQEATSHSPDETIYTWESSHFVENAAAARPYLEHDGSAGATSLIEGEIFQTIFDNPELLRQGIWLSDLDTDPENEQLDEQLQESRQAAIKYIAQEFGLAVEDVTAKQGDEEIQDTFIHAYTLAELPPPLERKNGVYISEDRILTDAEAERVMAARSWAKKVHAESVPAELTQKMVDIVSHLGHEATTLAITLKKPKQDVVSVDAERYKGDIVPVKKYEHVISNSEEDMFLARVDYPSTPVLPKIRHTADEIGYDVEEYQYTGSSDGKTHYDALLESHKQPK